MPRDLYTAKAHVTGGRAHGHGRTSDGALEVELRAPTELGGDGGGTNPEQLFAIGFASCFESALQAVARRYKQEVAAVEIDSKVTLFPSGDGGYELRVALDVQLPSIADQAIARDLVAAADRVCPYSSATRGNIEVALSANGHALERSTANHEEREPMA
ncbi:MAG TPA: organic hydroperoxide resistance protein [Solirubrobacteraceae bacterium]